jgi:hypothetical protein
VTERYSTIIVSPYQLNTLKHLKVRVTWLEEISIVSRAIPLKTMLMPASVPTTHALLVGDNPHVTLPNIRHPPCQSDDLFPEQ